MRPMTMEAEPRPPLDLSDARVELLDEVAPIFERLGLPHSAARVLSLLLVSGRPLSRDDIAASLSLRPAAVTVSLRLLAVAHLIEACPERGVDRYRFRGEGWEWALTARLDRTRAVRGLGRQSLASLAPDDPARARVAELVELSDLLEEAYLGALRRWRSR